MKKGAIFDMDGILFDTEKVWQKHWHELAAEYHTVLDETFPSAICGTSGERMCRVIEKYFHVENGKTIAEDCRYRVQRTLAENVPEKPGIHELLSYLREHNVKTAVASSSSREQILRNLAKTGTADYFDAVKSGLEVKNGKPAPDLFLAAAELIGIPPADCYVFEDAFNGVRAGHAAGMTTIMVPDLLAPDEEMYHLADAVCADMHEVLAKMEKGEL